MNSPFPPVAVRPPLDLPRLVMRRAALLACLVLGLALALGLARVGHDIDEEVDAAMTLASLMAGVGKLGQSDSQSALKEMRQLQARHPLRHLELQVHDAEGRALLAPMQEAAVPSWLGWITAVHRSLAATAHPRREAWTVHRPDGARWTISLSASPESERQEAMGSLLGMLGMLLLCVAGLLMVMRWNLRQAFLPLGRLLDAIAVIESNRTEAVKRLPVMPIRELESVAAAMRHLARSLDDAEARRRRLSLQVQSLQEDERTRLARELHDEFGQRLTALRVDTAWLLRRLADRSDLKPVVQGMVAQCEHVQQDIRALLTRLQPFARLRAEADTGESTESLHRLLTVLQDLIASWAPGDGRGGRALCELALHWQSADGQTMSWPDASALAPLQLPRSLALTLFRISQEALTNVARHARAETVRLSLTLQGNAQPGALVRIEWSVCDDGVGLPAGDGSWPRGNGLAGIQERVWAQGSDLACIAARSGGTGPGLCLRASFDTQWQTRAPADKVGL